MTSESMRIPQHPKEGLRLSPSSMASETSTLTPPSPGYHFQFPSPIITRRTRTYSASERASKNPIVTGKVKYFCRYKGHGYITPDNGDDDIFVHVSDVDGEYVPREGDHVSYRLCLIPPKNERSQAVHVTILNMPDDTHEKWYTPSSPLGTPLMPFEH